MTAMEEVTRYLSVAVAFIVVVLIFPFFLYHLALGIQRLELDMNQNWTLDDGTERS